MEVCGIMPSQEAHPLEATTAQATALFYIPGSSDCQAARVTLCLVEAGAREIVPDLLATPPLGKGFLAGLQTARDYLRSLQGSTNCPLWSQNTDLKLKIEAPSDGGPLPTVDGGSATALIAALGESLLRGRKVADRTCCVSADLREEPGEGYRLQNVDHVPEKTRAACEARLTRLVVSDGNRSAAKEAVDDYQRAQENHLGQQGKQATPVSLHVDKASTVAEVVRLLSEDTVVLHRYLDRIARRMVDDISLIDPSWRERFFQGLYQNQYVTYEETTEEIDGQRRRREKKTQVRKKWSEWAADKHRVSLLAEAGHGKSTLLRWITWDTARKSADQLDSNPAGVTEVEVPFFFRCEDLARRTNRGGLYPLEDSMVQHLCTSYGIETRQGKLLKELLKTDKALIVLDALDEAPKQRSLLRSIGTFAANYPQPRIYLSCRTRHFPDFNWPAGEASGVTIELSAFSPEDLSGFIERWGRLAKEPQRAEQFARQAGQNPTLASVVRIPLFAVLSCLTYLSDGKDASLPVRRVELLERCWESFDERWEREKREKSSFQLRITARRKALEHVAWHYARQGNFGSFPKSELREVLANAPGLAGKLQPEEVLHELPLLVPDGDPHADRYRFQVRQLQEYFAACALARQKDPFGTIKPVLHHPEWRETILLTAGVLKRQQAVQYIEAILDAGSRYELLLGRDLLVAAHCCGEVPSEYLEGTPLLDRLLKALEAMAVYHVQSEGDRLRRVRSLRTPWSLEPPVAAVGDNRPTWKREITDALEAMSAEERGTWAAVGGDRSMWEHEIIGALKAMSAVAQPVGWSIINNSEEEHWYSGTPQALLTALRFWEMRTPEELLERFVISNAHCYRLPIYSYSGRNREFILTEAALTEFAKRGSAGEAQFKQALSPKQDVRVRLATVEVLCHPACIDGIDGEVLPLVSETLRSDPDAEVRQAAVQGLCDLARTDERADQILPVLLEELRSDPHEHVRRAAVKALRELTRTDERADQILVMLLEALRSDPDEDVRNAAARSLGDLAPSEALPLLLKAATDPDEDAWCRREAVRTIAKPGFAAQAQETLLRLLQDEDRDVRSAAADALSWMGANWETLPSRLLEALHSPAADTRADAVEALAKIKPPADLRVPEVTRALSHEAAPVCLAAVRALCALGRERTREAFAHIHNLLWLELPTWLRDGPWPAEGIGDALDCAALRLEAAATLLSLEPPNLEVSLEALLSLWEVYWQLAGREPDRTDDKIRTLERCFKTDVEYRLWDSRRKMQYDVMQAIKTDLFRYRASDLCMEEKHRIELAHWRDMGEKYRIGLAKWKGREESCRIGLVGRACEIVSAPMKLPDPAQITPDQVSSLRAELDSPDLGLRWRARIVLESIVAFPEAYDPQIHEALERDMVRVEEARHARFCDDPRVEKRDLLAVPCEQRTADWLRRMDQITSFLRSMDSSTGTGTAALPEED
jgi:HEAT repeat protein